MKTKLLQKIEENTRVKEAGIAQEIGRYPYFKIMETAAETVMQMEGEEKLNFGSNNYLGLTSDKRVIDAGIEVMKTFGSGFTGSRLLNGNSVLHKNLEDNLAKFYNTESALVFPTGYTSNLGFLSSVLHRSYTVLVDEEIHASLWDGLLLSRCKVKRFRHNDYEHFEKLAQENENAVMCIIEGIYSMNGDIAPVNKFVEICEKKNIFLFVDEAHGVGVLGEKGRGATDYFNMLDRVDMISITFSKSLGGCGGALLGKKNILDAIRLDSRPFLFTASNTPSSLATANKALELLQQNSEWIKELQKKSNYFRDSLKNIGIVSSNLQPTPIVPIRIGEDFRVLQAWKILWNDGIFCNSVLSPAVPKGKGLLRFSIMLTHTYKMIDSVVDVIDKRIRNLITEE